jgi:hypothetical protein
MKSGAGELLLLLLFGSVHTLIADLLVHVRSRITTGRSMFYMCALFCYLLNVLEENCMLYVR